MNEDFILPEKWYIEITDDNRKIVNDWKIKQPIWNSSLFDNLYWNFVQNDGTGGRYGGFDVNWVGFFEEITTEQFINYVLNQQSSINQNINDLEPLKKLLINLNIK